MRHFLLTAISLLMISAAGAQSQFQKTYILPGFGRLTGLEVSASGDYSMAGILDFHSWFIRTDRFGQVLVSKNIETADTYTLESMRPCTDGGFILCASGRAGAVQFNLNLTRIDSMGNIMWSKAFGGSNAEFARAAIQTRDGGFLAAGTTVLHGTQSYLVKTDASGNLQWTKTYRDTLINLSVNTPNAIVQTSDDGYLICGTLDGGGFNNNAYIIKTDALGNIEWNKAYMHPEWNTFNDLKLTPDGNIILSGWVDLIEDSVDSRDFLLVKTDLSGNVLWAKAYAKSGLDAGYHVDCTSDGGYVLCGAADFNSSLSHCTVLKTDVSGSLLWATGFASYSNYTFGNVIHQTPDDGFIIGTTMLPTVSARLYMIKTDENGSSNCTQTTPVLTEENVSFTIISPFSTETLDSTGSMAINTSPMTLTPNVICFLSGINENDLGASPQIFPNPAQNTIQISGLESSDVKIIDALGRSVLESTHQNTPDENFQVDVHLLAKGIYFVQAGNRVMKFIKD